MSIVKECNPDPKIENSTHSSIFGKVSPTLQYKVIYGKAISL